MQIHYPIVIGTVVTDVVTFAEFVSHDFAHGTGLHQQVKQAIVVLSVELPRFFKSFFYGGLFFEQLFKRHQAFLNALYFFRRQTEV
ncbi:hypothetical protein EBT31_16590 [bacterium]|nr:hypothetical protein [bacterium]